MRYVQPDGKGHKQRRQERKKLIEGHSVTLAQNVIPPGFPNPAAKKIAD
jgi:hypothetical protein